MSVVHSILNNTVTAEQGSDELTVELAFAA